MIHHKVVVYILDPRSLTGLTFTAKVEGQDRPVMGSPINLRPFDGDKLTITFKVPPKAK
jgi:hypothetical protein